MLEDCKVLAITKRMAEMCASQPFIYAAGCDLITATTLRAARVVMQNLPVKAVIICKHSWSEQEREEIASELECLRPKPSYVMRGPGCEDYDETVDRRGILRDTVPLSQLLATIRPAEK